MKLLLALQFYPGDMSVAMDVARLIADLETKNRHHGLTADVEFLFAARFDCNLNDPKFKTTLMLMESVWKTHVLLTKRKEVGWPDGCNALWHETMMWSREKVKSFKANWGAVLTFESDCVPLTEDWIQQLANEWEKSKALDPDLISVGCLLLDPPHINGNAMFDAMLLQNHPRLSATPWQRSWDCFHGRTIVPRSVDTPLIVSRHGTKSIDEATIYAPLKGLTPPVFLHGVKPSTARDVVRKNLKL